MPEARPFRGEIYIHTNVVNGKAYVGQTTIGMEKRWDLHFRGSRSKRTKGYNTLICRAIRKYGVGAFEHRVISVARSQEELDNLERYWISLFQTKAPNGYNLADGGGGTPGHVVSPETRAILSAKTKEQWKSPEFRQLYAVSRTGKPQTPEHIEARVAPRRGKKQRPETIAKRVAKLKGKKRTLESRSNMSVAHQGLKWSEARRAAYEKTKGRPVSEETIAKIVSKNTGKKRTPDQVQNLKNSFTPARLAKLSNAMLGNTRTLGYKFSPEVLAKRSATAKRNRELKKEKEAAVPSVA